MNRMIRTLDEALASLDTRREPDRDLWPAIASAVAGAQAPVDEFGANAQAQGVAGAGGPSARLPPAVARRPLALAASIAVLGLAGSLAWNLHSLPQAPGLAAPQPGSVQGAAQPGGPAGGQSMAARFGPPDDAAYRAARAELEHTFIERLGLLAPATRERVQADLATIRAANADIRKALADDPASPLLLQLLGSTWQQEIDLYKNVARATTPMIHRSTRT